MNSNDKQTILTDIITLILTKEVVHYSDIEKYIQKSRKTVAKYLDDIEKLIADLDVSVELVRKRNAGIYFIGDVNRLMSYYKVKPIESNKDKRISNLLNLLLNLDEQITLLDLSNKLFESQSTLEKDLEYLKKTYNLKLSSNNKGIIPSMNEDEIRSILSSITKNSINQKVTHDYTANTYFYRFEIPESLKSYVDSETLEKVQSELHKFISINDIVINEYEYESILVHIAIAIKRILEGDFIEKLIITNEEVHPLTEKLSKQLSEAFDINIPNSEKKYLNLHILAIIGEPIDIEKEPINDDFLERLRELLIDHDETLISNLALHLRAAIKRGTYHIHINNPYKNEIAKLFPESFDLARNLLTDLSAMYPVMINNDEISYIAMHFQSFKERSVESNDNRISMIIVCSTGYGTSMFLSQRLKNHFGDMIKIVDTISVDELSLFKNDYEADLIISTIPIETTKKNVIQVSPLIKTNEMELLTKIVNNLQQIKKVNVSKQSFLKIIDVKNIIICDKKIEKQTAIKILVERLHDNGYVTEDMEEAALRREQISSTLLGNSAIPHGDIRFVKKPTIGLLINESGVLWDGDLVKTVFFIALNKSVSNSLDDIYSYFYDIVSDDEKIRKLSLLKEVNQVKKFLGGAVDE